MPELSAVGRGSADERPPGVGFGAWGLRLPVKRRGDLGVRGHLPELAGGLRFRVQLLKPAAAPHEKLRRDVLIFLGGSLGQVLCDGFGGGFDGPFNLFHASVGVSRQVVPRNHLRTGG